MRIILLFLLCLAAACRDKNQAEKKENSFRLFSPSFSEGSSIPEEFTCQGKNFSPALKWENPPPSGKHRYIFTLYAMDCRDCQVDLAGLKNFIEKHSTGRTSLTGTYRKSLL